MDVATSSSVSADEYDDADYVATSSGYRVRVPKQWDRKGKAGADVLWEDPNRRWEHLQCSAPEFTHSAILSSANTGLSCTSSATPTIMTHAFDCRSTAVGVTVNPVRVKSIEEFGTLDVVGEKLLDAERKKVCAH